MSLIKRIRKNAKELPSPRERRLFVLERDNYICKLCNVDFKHNKQILTVDHIIPKSKGGSDMVNNLQCACQSCNSKKGDKILNG